MSPKSQSRQGCLFEQDFLVRTLGSIANSAEVALTELVANAWDAGASKVEITLPNEAGEQLTIGDDGTGMTDEEFREKWMKLGYDRIRHQGPDADFPPDRATWTRPAYGRNGVGRHGMLCFAPEYTLSTTKEGKTNTYEIATTSGNNPFEIVTHKKLNGSGHGTILSCRVARNMPSPKRVAEILSAKFLHDPQFQVFVEGKHIPLSEHRGLISQETLPFGEGLQAEAFFVDSTLTARKTQYQGVAFWVGQRLVGEPGWAAGSTIFMDGRTRIAKRYTVVIKLSLDPMSEDVEADWSGFKRTPRVKSMFEAVADYVQKMFLQLSKERVNDVAETVIRQHREKLVSLSPLGRMDLEEFIVDVTSTNPTIATESLSAAFDAALTLEGKKGGAQLLEKLAKLSDEDVLGLDRLLSEWTVRDALLVLDEINRRLVVSAAIEKLSGDPKADELHSLHPLVVESRWLFGPEFDSPEFVSNVTLNTALRKLFGKESLNGEIEKPHKRADLIVLPDRTLAATATEQIQEETGLPVITQVLLIELKRGGAEITRENVNQAEGYVEDLMKSGLIDGIPKFRAFVIGHTISPKVATKREIEDRATIQVATYGQLIRAANLRLFRLRERLSDRYQDAASSALLDKVLAEPYQLKIQGAIN